MVSTARFLTIIDCHMTTLFDFMGWRRICMTVTSAAAAVSVALVILYATTSKDIFDVDFTGGTLVQFNFAKGKAR